VKNAADYLSYIKALIIMNSSVLHWSVVREEAQGDIGLLRYKLTLRDDGLLEMLERFRVVGGGVQVEKYSFHLQDSSGQLLKRWDNATHHPELSTSPHHIHDGAEENVQPHEPISAEKVLALITTNEPE